MPSRPPSPSSLHNPDIPRVALLIETSTSWGRRIIEGIGNYVRKFGPWHLFVDARGLQERQRVPPGWRGDGVIARVSSAAMGKELQELRLPVVNISGIVLQDFNFPQVTTSQPDLADLALSHFVDRGFRNFAYFSLLGVPYVATQQQAFMQAVRTRGVECSVLAVKPIAGAEPAWNLDLAKLGAWIQSLPKPVGILTWNAGSARDVLYACQLSNLLVPEEVSVLSGSDDDLLCTFVQPSLSGVLIAAEQIGHAAAELLDRMMAGKTKIPPTTLIPPVNIVTRRSTDTLALGDSALIKALSFIRDNAARPFRVSDVAHCAGVSRRVLERRFEQVLGRSPASEIRRVHLDRARELLIETDLPIPDVAESAGFGSSEYLFAAFKAHTGKTPLAYRKAVRSR